MITRTLRGLGALALIALALVGWPAALLGLTDAVAVWLPDLSDPAALLTRPDTGGLFLVIVLAVGWIAWVVWTVALIVEVAAQVRGVPTPHLGGLFPQNATAAMVTAIAVAFTLSTATPAIAGPSGAGPAQVGTQASQTVADRHTAARPQATGAAIPAAGDSAAPAADEQGDYTVVRGDTLWDIADEQLDDPTRYPEIVQASDGITQPDGRQLTDPDLILPGWTLNIPDQDPTTATPSPQPSPRLRPARSPDPPPEPPPRVSRSSPRPPRCNPPTPQGNRTQPPPRPRPRGSKHRRRRGLLPLQDPPSPPVGPGGPPPRPWARAPTRCRSPR
jgi:LysM repeat protein